jgi:hypothetical protein
MRDLKKDEVKSVAQTEVNLCRAGLWGRVAMIMKAQNPFRNRAQVIEVDKQRLSGSAPGKSCCV